MRNQLAASFALSLSILVAGCFSPATPPCSFICGDNNACPDDYMCLSDGYCHYKGMQAACGYSDAGITTDGGAGDLTPISDTDGPVATPDLSTGDASVGDMSVGDMSVGDMSVPDMTVTMPADMTTAPPDLTVGPDLAFPSYVACTNAAAYTTQTAPATIVFGNDTGTMYVEKCLKLSLGGNASVDVTWELGLDTHNANESFVTHPLNPGANPTVTSPITLTNTGTSKTFTFDKTGFYPYYCGVHGSSDTSGMAGVVQVVP